MKSIYRKAIALAGLSAVVTLGAACSTDTATEAETTTPAVEETTTTTEETTTTETAMADPAANLVGAGCAAYAEQNPTGPGSIEGMAQEPVSVAASSNPMLTTLAQALSGQLNPDVNLVETLDGGEFTVFAPTNEAFDNLPEGTIETLQTDADQLTSILTYHVVEGQADPSAVVGDHTTLQGGTVTVTGEGDGLMVNDAGLVCGGVQTANATVYMIDTVLMPPAN